MESTGETVDDQGSGWFQVKKKHRSGSKFSVQSWVGSFSGKNASSNRPNQSSFGDKVGNLYGKRKTQSSKGGGLSVQGQSNAANAITVSSQNKSVQYDDKRVVKQNSDCAPLHNQNTNDQGDTKKPLSEERHNVTEKIKWDDLEDESIVVCHERNVGVEINFGNISSTNDMVCRKVKEKGETATFTSSCDTSEEHKLMGIRTSADNPPQVLSSILNNQEDSKEESGVSPENVEEKIVCPCDDSLNCIDEYNGHVKPVSLDPVALSEMDQAQLTQDPGTIRNIETIIPAQDISESDKHEIFGEPPPPAAVRECGVPRHAMECDGIHKVQNVNAPVEDDSSESKERFRQRLWCFLFENLNRAVDELYLLCELECDLEQMKEAILVLEEAASDFKELTSRVEKFENAKRPSSLLADGMPITLKTDHRRPHALSWEVRRMTTSPHKAEILSSSIEAFRKIQEQRASIHQVDNSTCLGPRCFKCHHLPGHTGTSSGKSESTQVTNSGESSTCLRKLNRSPELVRGSSSGEKLNIVPGNPKVNLAQNGRIPPSNFLPSDASSTVQQKDTVTSAVGRKAMREQGSEREKYSRKDKLLTESSVEKHIKYADQFKRQSLLSEKEKEKRTMNPWKSMDAWKEKRNWEDILSSPFRISSRISHSPGLSRKSAEHARTLHDKLMSPDKKKKTAMDLRKEAEEKHARAMRIRSELENEKLQKLQRTSEKLSRVNEWQAVRNMKLREGMYARHQRSESRHEAFLAQVVRRAGDESSKVNEVRFITSLNEENKKLILRQKLHDSEMRRAEKLQVMKIKQKEDLAREEAVLERRKLIEAEKLQRLAETQRKKEEAQVRREEERRASSAAREARAMEQLRRKEVRAKAQQEEAELLAQKLAERLSESEQRRKFYLEQIKERASMDFRDQVSPLLRRSNNREGQGRSTPTNGSEDQQSNGVPSIGGSTIAAGSVELQHSMKRRIKRIRQRLMALKHDFPEPPVGAENSSIGYRTAVGAARAKIGRWLQELQRLRQARKEGAATIGLIAAEMIKFLEGKEPELQASRQAGLLDFIASALPASHITKPEACQVTIHLMKLLRVVLALPANRSYFLSQNLLPPIIPMMSAALENYIKIGASLNIPSSTNVVSSKTSMQNFESISEVLDGFLWTVTAIIGYASSDERQLQMREGLMELLIAYQVIHRLRDLFALYDRPQVEGSPFPSSIVFSIQLLMVLTITSETNNVIDWEVLPVGKEIVIEKEAEKLSDSSLSPLSPIDNSSGDMKPEQDLGKVEPIPGVTEDSPLYKCTKTTKICDSVSTSRASENAHLVDIPGELINAYVAMINGSHVASRNLGEDIAKSSVDHKDCKCPDENVAEKKDRSTSTLKQPITLLLSAISETGLVCLPSLLTSVLLQANNRLSSEQVSYILPSNFEEVATGVLKFLNNLAYLDITVMQEMLARPDLKMEFFHLMSFLLSHCNSKWKSPDDQVGLLLLESLFLLGHFALFHPENQAVLRWGNTPTILHKVCDLPFVFFSDPCLMPVLAGTLVAACYGSEQNRGVVQQELSVDMLLSLLKSCRDVLPYSLKANLTTANIANGSNEHNQMSSESKKSQADKSVKSARSSIRNSRIASLKGFSVGNNARAGKKKDKLGKVCEETAVSDNLITGASNVMLHCRFPSSFIDRAEKFFSEGLTGMS